MTSDRLPVGTLIDERHRVDGFLGEGGFATVYRAVDTVTGRVVAVKVLAAEMQRSAPQRSRFEREIQIVGQLRDPHTIRMFTHGELPDGSRYIMFEHLGGQDLAKVLERAGPLPAAVVVHILKQVLASLVEAHGAGVLHRDLKPENIRVFESARDPYTVKVLDFGIARLVDPQDARVTATGELLGTPCYMSPEQMLSQQLSPASDIYSLGVIANEMLGGDTTGRSIGDQLARLQSGHVVAIDGLADERLLAVIRRMTARAVEDRYQSAQAVLNALAEPSERPGPRSTTPPAVMAGGAVTKAKPLLIALVVAGSVLAIGGIYFAVSRGSVDPRPPPPPPASREGVARLLGRQQPEPRVEPVVPVEVGAEATDVGVTSDLVCPPRDRPSEMRMGTVISGAGHEWQVYEPARASTTRSPVVFVFHAQLSGSRRVLDESSARAAADRGGFVVIAPDMVPTVAVYDSVWVAEVLRKTGERACIDESRVFAVGRGGGGDVARKLACDQLVGAFATVGNPEPTQHSGCEPDPPVPHISLVAREDAVKPFGGGEGCLYGSWKSSVEMEKIWRRTNSCKPRERPWQKQLYGEQCGEWTCEAAFVSCRLAGGRGWPGSPTLAFDAPGCLDPLPPEFPMMDAIWTFFDSIPAGTE